MEIWRRAGSERRHRTALGGLKQMCLLMVPNLITFTSRARTSPSVQCCSVSSAKWRRMRSRLRFNRWPWTIWPYALISRRTWHSLSLSFKESWACSRIQLAWAHTKSHKPVGSAASSTTKSNRGPAMSACQQCRLMDP